MGFKKKNNITTKNEYQSFIIKSHVDFEGIVCKNSYCHKNFDMNY